MQPRSENTETIQDPVNAAHITSDDEDDSDYVPLSPKATGTSKSRKRQRQDAREAGDEARSSGDEGESRSSDSDSDFGFEDAIGSMSGEHGRKKRLLKRDSLQTAQSENAVTETREGRQQSQTEIWAKFKDSVGGTPTSTAAFCQAREVVKIQKKYLFAGETVTEIVEVRTDSPDAKKWPIWKPEAENPAESSTSAIPTPTPLPDVTPSPLQETPTIPTPLPQVSLTDSIKKRPGPRKSKVNLALLPGSSSGSKPKKLTTLDKSAMDWRTHIQSESQTTETNGSDEGVLKDELEAHRRGGMGYLDKVEFLKRVDDRKEGILDGLKNQGKRRRM